MQLFFNYQFFISFRKTMRKKSTLIIELNIPLSQFDCDAKKV